MSTLIDKVHISSLVIHCFPEKLSNIVKIVSALKNVEVATHDISGKIVAILETETEQEILSIIDQINATSGVLTTTMVYHEMDC